jgi:glycerophosphoryl diester phosphodiesterase
MKQDDAAGSSGAHALKIVGHRGARGLAAENTLASLRAALKHGVQEIEVDARVSVDGVAFLHHDQYLHDGDGRARNIRTHRFEDLRQAKPDIPTLEDAIRTVNRTVPLQIEVKWGENTAPIISVVRQFLAEGWQPVDFLFGSKKQRTLMELHQAIPEVPVVIIEPFFSLRGRLRARQAGSRRISMNRIGLWPFFIGAMARSGYDLYAYTVNDPEQAARWHRRGLRGVITDRPDHYGSMR